MVLAFMLRSVIHSVNFCVWYNVKVKILFSLMDIHHHHQQLFKDYPVPTELCVPLSKSSCLHMPESISSLFKNFLSYRSMFYIL